MLTIAEINVSNKAIVAEIRSDSFSQRFSQLGIIPGSQITVLQKNPWTKSMIVKIDNKTYALRKQEAESIPVLANTR